MYKTHSIYLFAFYSLSSFLFMLVIIIGICHSYMPRANVVCVRACV